MPGSSLPDAKATSPPSRPPAAPEPGWSLIGHAQVRALDDGSEMGQVAIEGLRSSSGVKPFCGPIDGRGSFAGRRGGWTTSQATVAISTPSSFTAASGRIDTCQVGPVCRRQLPGRGWHHRAGQIPVIGRIRLRHRWSRCRLCPPRPVSLRRRSPPGAVRRCPTWSWTNWVAFPGGHEDQPRGGRHLDHGGLTIAQ